MSQSMLKFYQLEGAKGYFKGNGANIIRIIPFSALEFYTFEKCKYIFLSDEDPRNKIRLLLCGSVAGIVASSCTYPLDLVRTLLSLKTDQSRGLMGEMMHIVHKEGLRGLYRGLTITLMVYTI